MKVSKFVNTPFKGLRSKLEKRHFVLRNADVREVKTDEEIFREAMSDVREIPEFSNLPPGDSPKVHALPCRKDDVVDILTRIVKGEIKIRIADTAEYMAWVKPHLRKDIVERLHRGDYAVQDSIDLHGMTLSEAEEALQHFFRCAVQKGFFCVKVIHGRGLRSPRGPVLKEALKKFLHRSFSKWILAYATASQCDGGLGATYVILKSG
jgi:DNA-nicking Smr family endonuclease